MEKGLTVADFRLIVCVVLPVFIEGMSDVWIEVSDANG
jgi:hypothetical protein